MRLEVAEVVSYELPQEIKKEKRRRAHRLPEKFYLLKKEAGIYMNNLWTRVSEKFHSLTALPAYYLKNRLVSLDVFRGIAIALMIFMNNQGGDVYYDAFHLLIGTAAP